jgi:hypothetical protein
MQILFLTVFSIIFLSLSLYLHQYFSIILIILCTSIFLIESIIYSKEIHFINILISFLYSFSYEMLYCLSDVLGKKYLNLYLDGVYLFLFKIGITCLIPLLIYDIIAYFFEFGNYHGIIKTFISGIPFWLLLFNIMFCIIFELFIWLIIYYFSPCHFIILEALEDFLDIIFSFFVKDDDININFNKEKNISFCILYPVLIFAVLVFNEIIILNFCKLNYNTKLYISNREKIDQILGEIVQNYEDDDEDEDEDKEKKLY